MTPCPACDAIAAAIVARPELRSLAAPELAELVGATPENASAGIAAAFRELTGHEPPRLPGIDLSFDDVLILLGRPSFVAGVDNGAPPMNARLVFTPVPSVLEHAMLLRPDLVSAPWVRFWRHSNGVAVGKSSPMRGQARGPLRITFEHGEAGDIFDSLTESSSGSDSSGSSTDPYTGWGSSDSGTPSGGGGYETSNVKTAPAPGGGTVAKNPSRPLGTPGLYQSSPSKQWIFSILAGWSPRLYAAQITGSENRARELIDLNAADYGTVGTPGSLSYNLAHFRTGDPIKIPSAWNAYISQDGDWGTKGTAWPAAPADITPPPPIKGTTGGTYTAGLGDGVIAGIKTQLAALGQKYPAMDLGGYPGLWDVNDVVDEAFRAAIGKFQAWANAQTSGPPATTVLRTDGALDEATHSRINAWTTWAVDDGVKTVPTATPGGAPTTFTPSWPTGTPGVPPGYDATAAKDLLPGAAPAGGATAASSGSSGGGGILAMLSLAYLAMKGM